MSTKRWTGHCVKTEIRRDAREVLASLDPNAPDRSGSGVYGCLYTLGLWLGVAVVAALALAASGGVSPEASGPVGLFVSTLFVLVFLMLLGHPLTRDLAMTLVWAVRQRLLWLPGLAQTVEDPGWVKQTARIPVSVVLDESGDAPTLSWTYDRDAATILHRERTPEHPVGPAAESHHAEAEDAVEVTLQDGGFTLDLTRPPDGEAAVHLNVRVGVERVAFEIAPRRLGLSGEALSALPMLEQDAVTLSEADQDSLIAALERVGVALGARMPAMVRSRVVASTR